MSESVIVSVSENENENENENESESESETESWRVGELESWSCLLGWLDGWLDGCLVCSRSPRFFKHWLHVVLQVVPCAMCGHFVNRRGAQSRQQCGCWKAAHKVLREGARPRTWRSESDSSTTSMSPWNRWKGTSTRKQASRAQLSCGKCATMNLMDRMYEQGVELPEADAASVILHEYILFMSLFLQTRLHVVNYDEQRDILWRSSKNVTP